MGTLCVPCLHRLPPSARPVRLPARFYYHLDTRDDDSETPEDGLQATGYFYYSLGPTFGEDGLIQSHGYVGMKAQQVGGLIANRYMGWHPSSYVDLFGLTNDPHGVDRRSGTQVAAIETRYDRGIFFGELGWWFMYDTGYSDVDLSSLDTITPPFGYAREEFAAQQRHDNVLGNEFDLTVGGHAFDRRVDLYMTGAVMIPGAFYSIPIARIAGDQLGSPDPAMPVGVMGGLKVRL